MANTGYVLIVEDDVELRATLALALERKFTVIEVSNGVEAIQVIVNSWFEERPILVITNLDMPVMDGRLLVKMMAIGEQLKHIPVIIVTGERNFFSDKYPVLRKPYSLEQMYKQIDSLGVKPTK